MSPSIQDVLVSTDINNLLRRVAQIVSDSIGADCVVIQVLDAVDGGSALGTGVGRQRSALGQLARRLQEQVERAVTDGLQEIPLGAERSLFGAYRLSPALLQPFALGAGLYISVRCGSGSLGLCAGRTAEQDFQETDARQLFSIMRVLCLTIEQEHAELQRVRNLRPLVEAKHQWESTLDALPQLICLLDREGRVIRANRTLEVWGLGEVKSVRGSQVHDMLQPGCSDPACLLQECWDEAWQEMLEAGFAACDYSDRDRATELHFSVYRSTRSQYGDSTDEKGFAFLVVEDVSQARYAERLLQEYNQELERRLQERTLQLTKSNAALKVEVQDHLRDAKTLRESERRYTCLVETTLSGLYIVNNGRVVFCNNRFAEIFGYSLEEMQNMEMERLFPSDMAGTASSADPARDTGLVSEERIIGGVTKAGRQLWLQRKLTRVECFDEFSVMGNVIDITEQKNTEDALRQSERELHQLSNQLLEAQEAERKRIASELHDSIGQSISAIKFYAENAIREYADVLPGGVLDYLGGAVTRLRETVEEVRKISMNLRPSMLDDLGLAATVNWFTREYGQLFPEITVEKRIDVPEQSMSPTLKVAVFRIIQEALNNIAKHAQASRVSIDLLCDQHQIALTIRDDGKGFRQSDLKSGQGFGLSSMRERAKLTEGRFTLETSPGAGTSIHVVWSVVQ